MHQASGAEGPPQPRGFPGAFLFLPLYSVKRVISILSFKHAVYYGVTRTRIEGIHGRTSLDFWLSNSFSHKSFSFRCTILTCKRSTDGLQILFIILNMEFIFASCTNNKTIAQVFCTSLPVAELPPSGDIRRRAAPERDRALRCPPGVNSRRHICRPPDKTTHKLLRSAFFRLWKPEIV